MQIAIESANQADVIALIDELDAYQKPLYPAESHHGVDISTLSLPHVIFSVARDESGHAIGCGAVVLEQSYGELKRMFVAPSQRGKGLGAGILQFLESEALTRGCTELMLETGYLQSAAIALYERCGYQKRGPFGAYAEDPYSVFMSKCTV